MNTIIHKNENVTSYSPVIRTDKSKTFNNTTEYKKVVERVVFGEDDREVFYSLKDVEFDKYKSSLSIAKVSFKDGTGGTAWRLGPGNLMMTSAHVISNKNIKEAKIEFSDYEYFCKESKYGGFCSEKNTKDVVNGEKIVYLSSSDNEKDKLDYALFTLEPKEFNSGKLDKYSYLEIDTSPLEQGDKIYIPQYGIEDEDGNEKFISTSESFSFESIDNDTTYDGSDEGTIKNIKGSFIMHHLDTTYLADGAPIISSKTNKVVAMNNGDDTDSNIGVDMNYIWPKIKSFYENSVLAHNNEHKINNSIHVLA